MPGNNETICANLDKHDFDNTMNYLNIALTWINVIGWLSFATSFIIIILAVAYISFLNSSEHTHLNKYAYAYILTSFVLTLGVIVISLIYLTNVYINVRDTAA